jgi:hypothetical protein
LKKRRSPRRHEVHPRDQRYRKSVFERGRGALSKVTGSSDGIELSLEDPRAAQEGIDAIKADFSDKSVDEQQRILRAVKYAADQSESYVDSGVLTQPDEVDSAIRCTHIYNLGYTQLESSFYRQRRQEERGEKPGKKVVRV